MGNVKPALKKLHLPGRDGKPMTLCQFPEAVGSRSRKAAPDSSCTRGIRDHQSAHPGFHKHLTEVIHSHP